jgi:hypothetical protein
VSEGGEELVLLPVRVAKRGVRLPEGGGRLRVRRELPLEEQERHEDEAEAEDRRGDSRKDGREAPPERPGLAGGEGRALRVLDRVERAPHGTLPRGLLEGCGPGPRPGASRRRGKPGPGGQGGEVPPSDDGEPGEARGLPLLVVDELPEPVEPDSQDRLRRLERRQRRPPLGEEERALGRLGAAHRQLEPVQLREDLV